MREAGMNSVQRHMERSVLQSAAGLGNGIGVSLVVSRHLQHVAGFPLTLGGGLNPSVTYTTPRTWHPHIYERPPRRPTSFLIADILNIKEAQHRHGKLSTPTSPSEHKVHQQHQQRHGFGSLDEGERREGTTSRDSSSGNNNSNHGSVSSSGDCSANGSPRSPTSGENFF